MATVTATRARPGRGSELVLLAIALSLAIYAYAQVGLNKSGAVPANIATYSGILVGLALLLHIILRWRAPYADPVILPCVIALNGIGLAMIYRLDLSYANMANHQDNFAQKQIVWTMVGVACAAAILIFLKDHRTLRRFTYTAMVVGLVLLVLPLVPGIGTAKQGSQIWIQVGPMSLQPAELAKIAMAIFFAGYLVTNRDTLALAGKKILGLQLPRMRDLGPILVAWALSLGVLVFEQDLGTSLLFFALFVAVLYISTDRISWIVIGLGLFAVGVVAVVMLIPHVTARFQIWADPFNPQYLNQTYGGSGQFVDGLFGLAAGGLFGTGWGLGRPFETPLAESDFIITSLGEELGLTGLIAILMIYLILCQRGMRTALGVRDGFGKLLAAGLSFAIAFQVFVVVGGVTGLIPLTGLTTPFLAYGGSSLLANWMIAALLLRISDGARRPPPPTDELDLAPVLAALDSAADAQATQVVPKI